MLTRGDRQHLEVWLNQLLNESQVQPHVRNVARVPARRLPLPARSQRPAPRPRPPLPRCLLLCQFLRALRGRWWKRKGQDPGHWSLARPIPGVARLSGGRALGPPGFGTCVSSPRVSLWMRTWPLPLPPAAASFPCPVPPFLSSFPGFQGFREHPVFVFVHV